MLNRSADHQLLFARPSGNHGKRACGNHELAAAFDIFGFGYGKASNDPAAAGEPDPVGSGVTGILLMLVLLIVIEQIG